MNTKRKREDMEIVWQTPANPPERHDYIFRNGVRYVKPYYFEFISHVKNRWAGKTIVDLFSDEFKGRPRDYYESAVKSGRIQVDGRKVSVSYVVQSSQKISHFLHRHEPPVMSWDVEILCEEPDVLTVCKPASVPVHPCGQYRKNTVVGILQAEYGLAPLFPVHRLDRLVSGLLILARSASRADLFRQQIESGVVQKRYIARVIGVFPEKQQVVNANVNYNAREGRSTVEFLSQSPGKLKADTRTTFRRQNMISFVPTTSNSVSTVASDMLNHQILVENCFVLFHRVGRSCSNSSACGDQNFNAGLDVGDNQGNSTASLKGKAACTKFTRISTNGKQSIVLCEPVTGRTHQIRVHLQYTGHPIANDMLYMSEFVSSRAAEGLSADRAAAKSCSPPDPISRTSDMENDSNEDFSIDPMCTNCPNLAPKGYEGNEEGLWLHCVKYSGPDWIYECPHPDWASLS